MKYVDLNKEIFGQIQKELPHTLSYLEGVDYKLQQLGVELIIRDSDHRWGSLQLEFRGDLDFEQQRQIEEQIKNYTESHCCLCGSSKDVSISRDYDTELYGGSFVPFLCAECQAKEEGPYNHVVYMIMRQSEDAAYRAKHIKVRLKTEDHNIIYRFADEIYYKNEQFLTLNRVNKTFESVKIAGVDIGLRDIGDERVYDGDVLLAEDKNGRRFWGMVKLAEWLGHKWTTHDSPSPQWRNFFLVHGWGNFDSPLMMATKFKIVGRVCDITNFDGSDASDGHYMVWCEENKAMDLDKIPIV